MSMLGVLRYPLFRRVWAGQCVNMVGDAMFTVVITLFLAGRDDGGAALGVVLACIATEGGVPADRQRCDRPVPAKPGDRHL